MFNDARGVVERAPPVRGLWREVGAGQGGQGAAECAADTAHRRGYRRCVSMTSSARDGRRRAWPMWAVAARAWSRRPAAAALRTRARSAAKRCRGSGRSRAAAICRSWSVSSRRIACTRTGADAKGRIRRHYRAQDVATPYEKLKSLPDPARFLKPGVSFEALDALAHAQSDLDAARDVVAAREELFRTLGREWGRAA